METSSKPNFSKATGMAQEFLVNVESIDNFPFAAARLIENTIGIKCMSYGRAKDNFNLNPKDFGSNSAILSKWGGRYVIFYNEKNSKPHIKYSILHEMGHLLLDHIQKDIEDEEHSIQEVETNFFVSQLLMPDVLIYEFIRRGAVINEQFLIDCFGVSREAASKKLSTLSRVHDRYTSRNEFEEWILFKFKAFMDDKFPDNINSIDWSDKDFDDEKERDNWR